MAESSGSVVSNNVNIQKQSSVVQQNDTTEDNKTDKVMEPMLVEDLIHNAEVPKMIRNLYVKFRQEGIPCDRTDVLAGLIYLLSIECGFVPLEYKDIYGSYDFNYEKVLFLSEHWPVQWKRKNYFKFIMCLSGFDSMCTINIVKLTEDIVVNSSVLTEEGRSCSYQLLLDPLTYFTSSGTDISVKKLQNLKHLSKVVKDDVLIPSRNCILRCYQQVYTSIEYLPFELVTKIALKLNVNDLLNFGTTSRCLNQISKEPLLWKKLLKRDFNWEESCTTYEELKASYLIFHRRKQQRNRILGFNMDF